MIAKQQAIPVTAATARPGWLRSFHCDRLYGLALLACLALLLVPLAGGDALRGAWRYERTAVAAGQWWRLATAHVVHLDARHALVNAAGFGLLWMLFARSYRPWQWLLAILLCLAVIDLGFWFLSPRLEWYVGASALLHGVFACGCVALLRQRDAVGIAAAALFVAKLAWEQWQGPLPFAGQLPVVTISHVYGAAGGLAAGLLLGRGQRLYSLPFPRAH
jgi:rhomboid family GlyGly-CTERM serine protease